MQIGFEASSCEQARKIGAGKCCARFEHNRLAARELGAAGQTPAAERGGKGLDHGLGRAEFQREARIVGDERPAQDELRYFQLQAAIHALERNRPKGRIAPQGVGPRRPSISKA